MPRYKNVDSPQGPTWFDWLPTWLQCALLMLITVPVTSLFFCLGMHCVQTGKAITLRNRDTDALEWFLYSGFLAIISGCIFAVMMGWMKRGTPHVSETHHRPK